MYRITTTTEKNATQSTTEYEDYRQVLAVVRALEKAALYSRILVEEFYPATGWISSKDKTYTPADLTAQRKLNKRIKEEAKVYKKVVESALRQGYLISLYDGEEYTVKRSKDKAAILAAGQSTDMDRLMFRVAATGESVGSVLFVYGNLASEVLADWTDNEQVNSILADAIAYTEKLADKGE